MHYIRLEDLLELPKLTTTKHQIAEQSLNVHRNLLLSISTYKNNQLRSLSLSLDKLRNALLSIVPVVKQLWLYQRQLVLLVDRVLAAPDQRLMAVEKYCTFCHNKGS